MSFRATVGLVVAFLLSLTGLPGVSAAASANSAQREIVFPVAQEDIDGLRWSDTWGAARSGGRSHIGVDLLGDKMMKLLAVRDSTVTWGRFDNGSGTIVKLVDSDGWEYQYIHLNNDTPGTDNGRASCEQVLSAKLCAARSGSKLTKGTKVSAGEFIGYMGDSGNAEWTTPHLHFEVYEPSGRAVNPTPFVDAALARVVSPAAEPTKVQAPEPAPPASTERESAQEKLTFDPSDAASKIGFRLNGRSATAAEQTVIATAIEADGVEHAIAEQVGKNPAAAMVDRLYLTFFQRHPDVDGLDYWLGKVGGGANLEEVAEWFAMSEEYQRRYAGRDFGQFLDKLYVDVLNRAPDQSGKAYWLDQLEDGSVTLGTIVVYFTEGEELVRAHRPRTELSVAYRALGLDRPTAAEVADWTAVRKSKSLVEALEVWLADTDFR